MVNQNINFKINLLYLLYFLEINNKLQLSLNYFNFVVFILCQELIWQFLYQDLKIKTLMK